MYLVLEISKSILYHQVNINYRTEDSFGKFDQTCIAELESIDNSFKFMQLK